VTNVRGEADVSTDVLVMNVAQRLRLRCESCRGLGVDDDGADACPVCDGLGARFQFVPLVWLL